MLEFEQEGRATLLRTRWAYGAVRANFLLTMLRLNNQKAQAAELFRVVANQVGCPSSSNGLAIVELAEASGHLERAAPVLPIVTAAYPTPAPRPAFLLFNCTARRELLGLRSMHRGHALREVIADVGS